MSCSDEETGEQRAASTAMLRRLQCAGVFRRFPKRDKLTERSTRTSVALEFTLTAQGQLG